MAGRMTRGINISLTLYMSPFGSFFLEPQQGLDSRVGPSMALSVLIAPGGGLPADSATTDATLSLSKGRSQPFSRAKVKTRDASRRDILLLGGSNAEGC